MGIVIATKITKWGISDAKALLLCLAAPAYLFLQTVTCAVCCDAEDGFLGLWGSVVAPETRGLEHQLALHSKARHANGFSNEQDQPFQITRDKIGLLTARELFSILMLYSIIGNLTYRVARVL